MVGSRAESHSFVMVHRKAVVCAAIVVGLAGYLVAQEGTGMPYGVTRQSVDGGGEMFAAGGTYELHGTIGQPDTGVLHGGGYQLAAAFWFPVLPGDLGEDGSIDLFDYGAFHSCADGPDGGLPPMPCRVFDVDESGTVDLADFAVLQQSFSGP